MDIEFKWSIEIYWLDYCYSTVYWIKFFTFRKERLRPGKVKMKDTLTSIFTHSLFRNRIGSDSIGKHQAAAINWLKNAHDSTHDDGVGYGYYLRGLPFNAHGLGWRPSYVETSGYIIETFLDIAKTYDDFDAAQRAERIGRWLLTVQNEDGSFSNVSMETSNGIIFDTGQVLFGLLKCFMETDDRIFQLSAEKAAYWLVQKLDTDGAWRQNTHLGQIHTYNTRVAWAMLEYCKIFQNEEIQEAARKNLYWAITQQTEYGLFENCSFKEGQDPSTHTIAYAIRGLFEGGILLGDDHVLSASLKAANRMVQYVDKVGFIPGRISVTGDPHKAYSCLTGNCQLAIIWFKMSEYFQEPKLRNTANTALNYVLSVHNIEARNPNTKGGVKGSHPIWGGYTPLAYPNWAAKFLIDAILFKEAVPSP